MNWNKINKPITVEYEDTLKTNYIFHEQCKQIEKICESFKDEDSGDSTKVISIVGERGSGKSSLILTAKNILEHKNYYSIGPLDPSVLTDSLKIIELILGEIYNKLKNSKNKVNKDKSLENQYDRVYRELKKALTVLNNIRQQKYALENETAIVLTDYADRANYEKIIRSALDEFKLFIELMQKKKVEIAVLIDDLDLVNNKVLYDMTEDIRKYLSTSVVVVLAYRESQLHNAITNRILSDNEMLLAKEIVSTSELTAQTSRYLQKLMPHANRVYLPTEDEVYRKSINSILDAISSNKDEINAIVERFGVKETQSETWIFSAIAKTIRINIKPIDAREKTKDLLPSNLREFLGLIKLLVTDFEEVKGDNNKAKAIIILRNIEKYKTYIRSHSLNVLSQENFKVLSEWEMTKTENKNFNMYFNIWNMYFNLKIEDLDYDDYLDIHRIQPQNVAIADVYVLIENLKSKSTIKSENLLHFVHTIKTYYSLELLRLYLQYYISEDENKLEEYLILLNSYVIPKYSLDEFKDLKKATCSFYYNPIRSDERIIEKDGNKYWCVKGSYDISEDEYNKIINSICYTTVPPEGTVFKGIRVVLGASKDKKILAGYRYRSGYTLNSVTSSDKNSGIANYEKGRRYNYDLFAFLGKSNYIRTTLNEDYRFVLVSLFDIDVFSTANYIRQTEDNVIDYFMKTIDNLLIRENDIKTIRLSDPIFLSNDNNANKFIPYFSENNLIKDSNNKGKKLSFYETFDLGRIDYWEKRIAKQGVRTVSTNTEDRNNPKQEHVSLNDSISSINKITQVANSSLQHTANLANDMMYPIKQLTETANNNMLNWANPLNDIIDPINKMNQAAKYTIPQVYKYLLENNIKNYEQSKLFGSEQINKLVKLHESYVVSARNRQKNVETHSSGESKNDTAQSLLNDNDILSRTLNNKPNSLKESLNVTEENFESKILELTNKHDVIDTIYEYYDRVLKTNLSREMQAVIDEILTTGNRATKERRKKILEIAKKDKMKMVQPT